MSAISGGQQQPRCEQICYFVHINQLFMFVARSTEHASSVGDVGRRRIHCNMCDVAHHCTGDWRAIAVGQQKSRCFCFYFIWQRRR